MIIDDDKDTLAAEYVLGTLGADERAEAQALIAIDPGFAQIVGRWERRLGELSALVAPVEPPPQLWEKVKTLVAGVSQSGDITLPDIALPPVPVESPPPPSPPPAEAAEGESKSLPARSAGWRWIAVLFGLVALMLAGLIGLRELRPEMLPNPLRPTPIIQVVQKERIVEIPSPRPAQYIAALQKEAFAPVFLLTFDMDRKLFTVRAMAAPKQAGKSYELWLVSPKQPGPLSLGVVGAEEFTVRPARAEWDSTTLADATYGISLESEGGSASGAPSGPMIFSGRLIQATPPGLAVPTP